MKKLSIISSEPHQEFKFYTPKGEIINFEIRYLPRQQTWIMNIDSDKLKLNGLPIQCSPNLLENYRNKINWGIKVASKDGQDPFLISDFASGRCAVAIIDGVDLYMAKAYLNDK